MGISPQAFYRRRRRVGQRRREEEEVLCLVRLVRRRHRRLGVRKLLVKMRPWLEREGMGIGRDRLLALLWEHELLVPARRCHHRTTRAGTRRAPNLLAGRSFGQPDAAWVADITYLELVEAGFAYLFVIMDLYSRHIVGWCVSSSLAAEHALEALGQALRQACRPLRGTIHHSDHGAQYTSRAYWACLQEQGLQASMGEVGNAYDNAYAERLLGTLKQEYGLAGAFRDVGESRQAVAQAVHFYNTDRPHMRLDYATPWAVYHGSVTVEPVSVAKVGALP